MKIFGALICRFIGHRKGRKVHFDTTDTGWQPNYVTGKTCYECPRCGRRLWRKARGKAK